MIEITQLTKRYGALTAVDDISFTVEPGEVLGFLGPNGAGKSTTMKMIAGFLAPTSGTVRVCGHDVADDPLAAERTIGYLPEGAPELRRDDRARRSSTSSPTCAASRARSAHARSTTSSSACSLDGRAAHSPSRPCRRASSAASASPRRSCTIRDVLILDEPTDGLDPNQKHEVRTLINDMAKDKTIVISTHILEEVDAVCTRAIIIAEGRHARRRHAARTRGALALPQRGDAASRGRRRCSKPCAPPAARAMSRAVEIDPQDRRLTAFPTPRRCACSGASASCVKREGWQVEELQLERGRLDEVFRTITAAATARRRAHEATSATIFQRELASYFATPLAYVFIVIFLRAGRRCSPSTSAASTSAARPICSRSSTSIPGSTCS